MKNPDYRGLSLSLRYRFRAIVWFTCFFLIPIAFAMDPNSEENRKWWAGEESYTIHFQGEMTLSDLLDAGIRPRHVPALGHHSLQFQAKSVSFVFADGESIQTKNGYGRIYVGADHRILNITFYEDYKTGIDEALERLREAHPLFGEGSRSFEELEEQVKEVRNAEDHWVDMPFGIGRKSVDEYWGGSVIAGSGFNKERPFRFITTAIRNYKDRENDRPQRNPMGVLLEPPPGYEHISFEYVTTPTDPNATPFPYLTPLEQAQKMAENMKKRDAVAKETPIPFPPTSSESHPEENPSVAD